MTDTPSRFFGLLLVLVAIWIAVYWLWQPSGPGVTVDPSRADRAPLAAVDQRSAQAQVPVPEPDAKPIERVPLPLDPVTPEPIVQTPTKPQPPATRKVAKVIKPEYREYVVKKGDVSWEKIAARSEVYGDKKLWRAVAQANPLTTSDRLRPGVKLKIAVDPDNIQDGRIVWVDEPVIDESPSPDAPGTPIRTPAKTVVTGETTYEIKSTDTLWSIAKEFLGSGAKWRTIHEANRDVITNPDRLPVGATIKIPKGG